MPRIRLASANPDDWGREALDMDGGFII